MKLTRQKIMLSPESELDVDLVRLMACFNDVQQVTKALLENFTKEPVDELEAQVLAAERTYYLRMICGHLFEGMAAFRRFCTLQEVKDAVEKMPEDCQIVFSIIRDASEPGVKNGIFKTVHGAVRSDIAFHYNANAFSDSLRAIIDERSDKSALFDIVIGEKMSGTRYIVADNVLGGLFGLRVNVDVEELRKFIQTIRDVQIALSKFIDCFLFHSGHVV